MLEHSFSHVPGIGRKAEQALWKSGIEDWDACLNARELPLGRKRTGTLHKCIRESRKALERRDHRHFAALLPPAEHWRLFREFKGGTAYLDIETNGLSPPFGEITTIALYDGRNLRCYINGWNLEAFPDDIRSYELLVTYNGKCFDLPYISDYFGETLEHSHIDLRHVLRSLGSTGGLKGCEKQFGLHRCALDGVDGYYAVLLWEIYRSSGRRSALETLLAYNAEDVINLEHLMHQAYNRKIRGLPFASRLFLEIPDRPDVPFAPDGPLIEELKYRIHGAQPLF
jgi:hypothetical protein